MSPSDYNLPDRQKPPQARRRESVPSRPQFTHADSANTKALRSTTTGSSKSDNRTRASAGADVTSDSASDTDPHHFYRRYSDAFKKEPGGIYVLKNDNPDGNESMMALTMAQRPPGGFVDAGHHKSRSPAKSNHALENRSANSRTPLPSASRAPSGSRSVTPSSNLVRGRQTSLQALVNKFNQTPDEVPPLPAHAGSGAPSRSTSANAGVSTRFGMKPPITDTRAPSSRSGRPTKSQTPRNGNNEGGRLSVKKHPIAQPAQSGHLRPDGPSMRRRSMQLSDQPSPNNTRTSEVLAESSPPRKPLFGEVLGSINTTLDVFGMGYGVPPVRQRRLSDGSMHQPNAMFRDESTTRSPNISPSSPTAWYMGVTPNLDGIDLTKPIPPRPEDFHRRSRSDITSIEIQRLPRKKLTVNTTSSGAPTLSHSQSPTNSRRSTQSRIPVRARPGSSASSYSDNRTDSRSSRTPDPKGRALQSFRTLNSARQARISPEPSRRSITPSKSPRYRHGSPPRQPSPRLQAYISDSAPARSPPLRSSRPRQSIAMASTTASRAKANGASSSKSPTSKPSASRPLPELGGVDFAARRKRIQQAFTNTVNENEIAAKQQSRTNRADRLAGPNESFVEGENQGASLPDTTNTDIEGNLDTDMGNDDSTLASQRTPALTLDTTTVASRNKVQMLFEDSPTLGLTDAYYDGKKGNGGHETSPSEQSAVTPETAETTFDHEPQDAITLAQSTQQSIDSTVSAIYQPRNEEGSDSQQTITEQGNEGIPRFSSGQASSAANVFNDKTDSSGSYAGLNINTRSQHHGSQLPGQYEGSAVNAAHASLSTTESSYYQRHPWSPDSAASSGQATERDTYSTINRLLDAYHDPTAMSPNELGEVKRLMAQSPNLARAGSWDPRKVMQLYLEDLKREKQGRSAANSEPLADSNPQNFSHSSPQNFDAYNGADDKSRQQKGPSTDSDLANIVNAKSDENYSSENLQALRYDPVNRASLNNAADWAFTSPSMADWIQRQAMDTPVEGPAEPPFKSYDSSPIGPRLQASKDLPPILPNIKTGDSTGIGINISIDSPRTPNSAIPQANDSYADLQATPRATMPRPTSRASSKGATSPSTRLMSKYNTDGVIPGNPSDKSATNGTTPQQDKYRMASVSSEATARSELNPEEQKRLTRRLNIVKELVDTESSFGQDMTVVVDIYKETSHVILNSSDDVKVLFGNAAEIVTFSTTFLDALKKASKSVYVLPKSKRWRTKRDSDATTESNTDDQSSITASELTDDEKDRLTSIGQAFEHHLTQMERVYTDYLKNHEAASHRLQMLQKSEKVQIWLKECRAYAHDLTTAWDLDSLLVKPVQRLLKYPLLLKELIEVTPDNHPDFFLLDNVAREMVGVSVRINEAKKRADLVEQVSSGATKKRKDPEGRSGLSKAFGRRSEKLKQQVGLSDIVQDRDYNALADKFGSHFFQVQVVMRDIEMYTVDVQNFVNKFSEIILALEAYTDVAQSSYLEIESKWRAFRLSVRELQITALTDHINAVRKHAVEPMVTLLKLYEGPQKLMDKRKKRVIDYGRFKAMLERGERIDKKTTEQGEQFVAVNETLKDELPKLFACTKRLVEACLNNFVQIQLQWQIIWRRKLSQAIDSRNLASQVSEIVNAFSGDFQYAEAQAQLLRICNGTFFSGTPFLSTVTTLNGDNYSTSRRPSSSTDDHRNRAYSVSTSDPSRTRGPSINDQPSPFLPRPDIGRDSLSSYLPPESSVAHNFEAGRLRAGSSASGRSYEASAANGWRSPPHSGTIPPAQYSNRPSASTSRTYDSRTSQEAQHRHNGEASYSSNRPNSNSAYRMPPRTESGPATLGQRYSAVFSSALPLSDSPVNNSPVDETPSNKDFNVLFLAASVYEFNIDRARREAGYPYLTYVAGEIFDVIGEKGELWLAKNQDDRTNTLGWIWNKHFAKLAS